MHPFFAHCSKAHRRQKINFLQIHPHTHRSWTDWINFTKSFQVFHNEHKIAKEIGWFASPFIPINILRSIYVYHPMHKEKAISFKKNNSPFASSRFNSENHRNWSECLRKLFSFVRIVYFQQTFLWNAFATVHSFAAAKKQSRNGKWNNVRWFMESNFKWAHFKRVGWTGTNKLKIASCRDSTEVSIRKLGSLISDFFFHSRKCVG